ncbi:MAG: YaaC family protein, partial [Armatimonadetes bacterium]|nr:YaaC family protein [Armatimonadota bacterium]
MRRYVDVKTRDRETTCWEMLRWFESQKYVEEQLSQRHGATMQDVQDKAREIVSFVVQGREYFEAARQVSLATQPTLQYYGMACLASAITVSALPACRQADLGKGHGLRLDESQGCSDLNTLAVRVTSKKGTLLDLLSAVTCEYYH